MHLKLRKCCSLFSSVIIFRDSYSQFSGIKLHYSCRIKPPLQLPRCINLSYQYWENEPCLLGNLANDCACSILNISTLLAVPTSLITINWLSHNTDRHVNKYAYSCWCFASVWLESKLWWLESNLIQLIENRIGINREYCFSSPNTTIRVRELD